MPGGLLRDARWLLVTTLIDGLPAITAKPFTEPPSTQPEEAGARPAILATLYLAVLLLAMTVPIGVATAIYLEEYARKERWYNRLLELNIQNLAASRRSSTGSSGSPSSCAAPSASAACCSPARSS